MTTWANTMFPYRICLPDIQRVVQHRDALAAKKDSSCNNSDFFADEIQPHRKDLEYSDGVMPVTVRN